MLFRSVDFAAGGLDLDHGIGARSNQYAGDGEGEEAGKEVSGTGWCQGHEVTKMRSLANDPTPM